MITIEKKIGRNYLTGKVETLHRWKCSCGVHGSVWLVNPDFAMRNGAGHAKAIHSESPPPSVA